MAYGHHYVLFHTIQQLSEATVSNSLKLGPYWQQQECSTGSLVFGNMWFMGDNMHYPVALASGLVVSLSHCHCVKCHGHSCWWL